MNHLYFVNSWVVCGIHFADRNEALEYIHKTNLNEKMFKPKYVKLITDGNSYYRLTEEIQVFSYDENYELKVKENG